MDLTCWHGITIPCIRIEEVSIPFVRLFAIVSDFPPHSPYVVVVVVLSNAHPKVLKQQKLSIVCRGLSPNKKNGFSSSSIALYPPSPPYYHPCLTIASFIFMALCATTASSFKICAQVFSFQRRTNRCVCRLSSQCPSSQTSWVSFGSNPPMRPFFKKEIF